MHLMGHWPRRIGSVGTRGRGRGVSGARRGLRHEGRCRKVGEGKRNKREGRVVGTLYLVKDWAGR
jgi:hypothetical protein